MGVPGLCWARSLCWPLSCVTSLLLMTGLCRKVSQCWNRTPIWPCKFLWSLLPLDTRPWELVRVSSLQAVATSPNLRLNFFSFFFFLSSSWRALTAWGSMSTQRNSEQPGFYLGHVEIHYSCHCCLSLIRRLMKIFFLGSRWQSSWLHTFPNPSCEGVVLWKRSLEIHGLPFITVY